MERVQTRRELQAKADAERSAGHRIALVPTMGALHKGHLSLIETARAHADRVWVSIFVNPTQFNEDSDFRSYPADLAADSEACRAAGVDLVYTPGVEDLYPEASQTWVEVDELTRPLCGAGRPGHFRGVTTVVAKLFLAAKPHVAVFGEKDFQQLAAIRRMARDLGFDIEVVGSPTVREPDGLALSSRNVRLGPMARQQATAIVRSLDRAEQAVAEGERDRDRVLEVAREGLAEAPRAEVEYAELRHPESLESAPEVLEGPVLLALAVHFPQDPDGRGAAVRLIDNRVIAPESPADVPTRVGSAPLLEERP